MYMALLFPTLFGSEFNEELGGQFQFIHEKYQNLYKVVQGSQHLQLQPQSLQLILALMTTISQKEVIRYQQLLCIVFLKCLF